VRQVHLSDPALLNQIFKITWVQQPDALYADYMGVRIDGTVTFLYSMSLYRSPMIKSVPSTLLKERRQEIQRRLESLVAHSSIDPLGEVRVVTLSFFWQGEHHLLSFNEASCPFELYRLLEMTLAAAEDQRTTANPCAESVSGLPPSEEQDSPGGETYSIDKLPELVKRLHRTRLFALTWYEQPFNGLYNNLELYADYVKSDDLPGYWLHYWRGERGSPGAGSNTLVDVSVQLTASEKERVQALLESMSNTSPTELPPGDTLVTLSFLWEANQYLFHSRGGDCPQDFSSLLAVANTALQRQWPEFEGFQSPCGE
jgi:hypothetical protein